MEIEFIDPVDAMDAVKVETSADESVMVHIVQQGPLAYGCRVYARYEWMRADGSARQFMYEVREGPSRSGITSWSEAVAYARSLTHGLEGL